LRRLSSVALAGLGLIGLAVTASVPPAASAADKKPQECFRANEWQSTTAGGPRDLYLRVGMREVWHLVLAEDCPGAMSPGPVRIDDLVTGNGLICTPYDLQIAVAPSGFSHSVPCAISEIHHLTHLEAGALPRKSIP
jgi:hypothetical protein